MASPQDGAVLGDQRQHVPNGRLKLPVGVAAAAACHTRGLLVLTAGTYGNVLRFLPPLVIGDHLLTEGLEVLSDAFAALEPAA